MAMSANGRSYSAKGAEIMVDKMVAGGQSCPTVLVIDDEERVREGCRKVLARDGYEVTIAESGGVGLNLIEQQHYDLVLLDLMMPSLSGFDVLAHVKKLHPDTVIIVISGYATVENSIAAMKQGAFDFIPKPFSPEQLRVLTRKAIEYTRTMQDIAEEKSRMRVLINRLTDGVMATDSQKHIVLANPAFLRMMGCQEVMVVGRPADEVFRSGQLDQMMDRALAIPKDELMELAEEIGPEGGDGQAGGPVLSARCLPFLDRAGRNI